MSQRRCLNFGDSIISDRINGISVAIVSPAVLVGANFSVGADGKTVNISPHSVMLTSLILTEDAITSVTLPPIATGATSLPSSAADYTIVYEHTNKQIQGGVPAILKAVDGLISFTQVPDTVVLGWVRWTGGGGILLPSMLIEAPKIQMKNPDNFHTDIVIPPFLPKIYVKSDNSSGNITQIDTFDSNALTASLDLKNIGVSLYTIEYLLPFNASDIPPSRLLIKTNVPAGSLVTAALVSGDGTTYQGDAQATISNTSSLFELRESLVRNVDPLKFIKNEPYFVSVIVQVNGGDTVSIALVGTSLNFLPL